GAPHRGGTQSGFVDHGHHAGFWRDTFLSLGGYNENMIANEDAEYDTRLRAQGGRIWLEADLRMGYYPRETVMTLWRQYFAYGRGRAEHIRRHRVTPRLRQCLPVIHTLFLLGFLCLLPLSAWGAAYPVFYGSIISLFGVWLSYRHRKLSGLFSPIALAVMHTSWGIGFLQEFLFGRRDK
ncbi:MAG: glycosyltransferase family 2 protein, partial [Pseudomonadota bacterium]